MRRIPFATLAAAALVAAAARHAAAEFVVPPTWSRTDTGSTYQEWDVFTSPSGDPANVPDVGLFNPNSPAHGEPNVLEASGASFLTSGSNIYSFATILDIDVVVPDYGLGEGFHTTVILQTRTFGREIDYAGVHIGGVSPDSSQELSRIAMGSPGGETFEVDSLFRWELPGNASAYTIEFAASDTSMSFNRVSVDTLVTLLGDANRDCVVDISDIQAVAANWQTAGPVGDINGNGFVDISDIQLIAANWQRTHDWGGSGGSLATIVPEPATCALGAMALAAMLAVARRHSRRGGR